MRLNTPLSAAAAAGSVSGRWSKVMF